MKKAIVGFVWVISLGLFIYSLIKSEQWILNGTLIIGWLLFALQITMTNIETVYLFIKRRWFEFINPDCIWNMQIVFKGDFSRDILIKIEDQLKTFNNSLKIQALSNTRKIYTMKSIRFETSINENIGEIQFVIHDMEISYRRSKRLIEREIAAIIEKIQTVLKPDSGQYGLNVEFNGYNPYFGFYVRRLNAGEVQGFNVTFKIDNNRVAINKNSIEINTDSLQHLSILSKEYLALSPAK